MVATTTAAVWPHWNRGDKRLIGPSLNDVPKVMNFGVRTTSRNQQDSIVAVFIDKNVMESAGIIRRTDARDFLDAIWKVGYIEDDGSHVSIRATLAKL
jgi:hypothetical protein